MSDVEIEEGSGNVYADLGFADADEMNLKAKLAQSIHGLIRQKKLSHKKVGDLDGLTQLEVSLLLRGHFNDVSVAKMIKCITGLGLDVDIIIKPPDILQRKGRLEVVDAQ